MLNSNKMLIIFFLFFFKVLFPSQNLLVPEGTQA